MNKMEFEQFVLDSGPDILRFCRMITGLKEQGDELYQDTMLKLLEKRRRLDARQNTKSYALSTAIFLWKNKRKKYSSRMKLAPVESLEEWQEHHIPLQEAIKEQELPEQIVLRQEQIAEVQLLVADLPEEYRIVVWLFYSANMKIRDISDILNIPEETVKTRMRKAKQLLKKELEDKGYDR